MVEIPPAARSPIDGQYGRAVQAAIPDVPEAAETLCHWLINAPYFHPLWTQYCLAAVRLRDAVPDFPPPSRQFVGTTHEILIVCDALDPKERVTVEQLETPGFNLPFLTPINIAHQVIATDDEVRYVVALMAWSIVTKGYTPETADAPERIRAGWLQSIVKTLAYVRGEEHAP